MTIDYETFCDHRLLELLFRESSNLCHDQTLPSQTFQGSVTLLHVYCAQAVRKKGVEPEWAGSGIAKGDRGCVYVMDNFDCSEFKAVSQSGKCR